MLDAGQFEFRETLNERCPSGWSFWEESFSIKRVVIYE